MAKTEKPYKSRASLKIQPRLRPLLAIQKFQSEDLAKSYLMSLKSQWRLAKRLKQMN